MAGRFRGPARAVCIAALVALLAGCGGGQVTKQQVVARADAICSSTVAAARALPKPADSGSRYLERLSTLFEHEASQLRRLPRPTQDRAALDLFVRSLGVAAGQYRQLAAAVTSGEQAQAARLRQQLSASPAVAYAAGYGLRACTGVSGTFVTP